MRTLKNSPLYALLLMLATSCGTSYFKTITGNDCAYWTNGNGYSSIKYSIADSSVLIVDYDLEWHGQHPLRNMKKTKFRFSNDSLFTFVEGTTLNILRDTFIVTRLTQKTLEMINEEGDTLHYRRLTKSEIKNRKDQKDEDKNLAQYPTYPGGTQALVKFIESNLCYPEKARMAKIEGEVTVGFVIKPDGSVTNIEIVKSVDPELDREALRVVGLMPKWTPFRRSDVDFKFSVPIRFSLTDNP